MDYLIFRAFHKESGGEILYLYNETISGVPSNIVTKRLNYALGVIVRDLQEEGKPSSEYQIYSKVESYRVIKTNLGNYKFIEPRENIDGKFIYQSPTYPALNKVGIQPNSGWLLSKMSRGRYLKED